MPMSGTHKSVRTVPFRQRATVTSGVAVQVDDLESLCRRAATGDTEAVDRLLEVARPAIMQTCRRILPHQQDAEDACQDALLRVARHVRTYEARSHVRAWLNQIAVNAARDVYRRRASAHVSATGDVPETVEARTTSQVVSSRLDLLNALARLDDTSPDLVEPFVMREIQDMTYRSIADTLGRPIGTVKRQVHTARIRLRELL